MIFYGIRPVVVGLIISAALLIAQTSILKPAASANIINAIMSKPLDIFDIKGAIVLLMTLISMTKFKLNPMLAIAGSGVMGVVLYYLI